MVKQKYSFCELVFLLGLLTVILAALGINVVEFIRIWAVKLYYLFAT